MPDATRRTLSLGALAGLLTIVVVLIGLGAIVQGRSDLSSTTEDGPPASDSALALAAVSTNGETGSPEFVRPTLRVEAVSDTVERGDTFSSVLMRNRVSVQEIGRILTRMRTDDLFSPRALRPGQILTVSRDEYGVFEKLRFEISPEEVLVFAPHGDSLHAEYEDVDREVRLRKMEGQIVSSFDEAVRRAGGDYRLTLQVADLLAYDVDFFTEVRENDRFVLLVEERFVRGRFIGYGEVIYASYEGRVAQCETIYYSWNDGEDDGHYLANGEAMKKAFLKSPLNYRRISSHFGHRKHPTLKVRKHHTGVDLAADRGTPIVALGDGIVTLCGRNGGYGNCIKIKHNARIVTLYGHLHKFAKGMHTGRRVSQNEIIGYVGSTGRATGPHLHFEVIENGRQINPMKFENEPAEPIPAGEREPFLRWAGRVRSVKDDLVAGQVMATLDPRAIRSELAMLTTGAR